MYGKIKTPHLIPRLQTLPFPKPAHLQWAQDQGAGASLTISNLYIGVIASLSKGIDKCGHLPVNAAKKVE